SLHSSLPSCFVVFFSFFFNAPPPPHIYTLSLHDALPISFPPASKSATSPSLISRESVRWPSIVPQFGRPRPVELNLAVVERFERDRKSTRLNSSHDQISYAVFCLKKKKNEQIRRKTGTQS